MLDLMLPKSVQDYLNLLVSVLDNENNVLWYTAHAVPTYVPNPHLCSVFVNNRRYHNSKLNWA